MVYRTVGDTSPKPKVVDDMYRSTLVKGENMSKIHGGSKKGGGRTNQYGEKRTIAGK
jgi:hypothetical protein